MTDTEQAVLGAMMLDRHVATDVLDTLTGADFHSPRHELIFDAIARLHEATQPADAVTVAAELGADLERAGGVTNLHHIISSCPVPASGPYYADQIRAASLRRQVRVAGERLTATTDDTDPLEAIETARAEIDALTTSQTPNTTALADYVDDAINALEHTTHTPTAWSELTHLIGGWRPGCLYVVGARPGVGKTVFGVQAALDIARRGQAAHIASAEMSAIEITHRLAASIGSIDMGHIMHRNLSNDDWTKIAKARAQLGTLPMHIDDRGRIRTVDVRSRARTISRNQTLGLVVVDYLQLLTPAAATAKAPRHEQVADMSRSLKLISKELQVPVVALAQLNRGSEQRTDRRPMMSDLRESGAVEQDADVVILLHRDESQDPTSLDVAVVKNRHGTTGHFQLVWEGHYARCVSRATNYGRRTA